MDELDSLRQELRREMQERHEAIDRRLDAGDRNFQELIVSTKKNTEAMTQLIEETSGIIKLYRDVEGVYRFGKAAQQFGLWVIKWPVIGTGILAMYFWLKENFPS